MELIIKLSIYYLVCKILAKNTYYDKEWRKHCETFLWISMTIFVGISGSSYFRSTQRVKILHYEIDMYLQKKITKLQKQNYIFMMSAFSTIPVNECFGSHNGFNHFLKSHLILCEIFLACTFHVTQFYTQLVFKPHFETWILLFGPFG